MYFDGQGTQILPCGKIPGGGGGYRLAHGLIRERASEWCVGLCVTVRIENGCEKGGGVYPKC